MPHPTQPQHALKVAVLGAGGGIGQSLSLLLKTGLAAASVAQDARVHLALYDVNRDAVAGAAVDLSHIDTPVSVSWHAPTGAEDAADPLQVCLTGAQIVVIPAGVPRKPGMTRDDLFSINAKIVTTLADGIARHCDLQSTFVLLISNPVNSLVPVLVQRLTRRCLEGAAEGERAVQSVAAQIPRRVFGLTQLDSIRASSFLHQALGCSPAQRAFVPVVGGHSGATIVPLFSQARVDGHALQDGALDAAAVEQLVHRVQYGGDEVVKAKNGMGSATLSMAYAAAHVTRSFVELLVGLRNEVQDTLYVQIRPDSDAGRATEQVGYFSLPVTVTVDGLSKVQAQAVAMGEMNQFEREQLWPQCIGELRGNIERAQEWSSTGVL